METAGSSTGIRLQYPVRRLDKKKKAEGFEKIWPDIEKLYDGSESKLFKDFSSIVYNSMSDSQLANRTPEQLYNELVSYFESFTTGFKQMDSMGSRFPGAMVKVEDLPEKLYPAEGGSGATIGITIHAMDSPFIFENMGGYLNITGRHIAYTLHPVMMVKRDKGKILNITPPGESGTKEVFIHFRVGGVADKETIAMMEKEIWSILESLYLSVSEFRAMSEECAKFCGELRSDKVMPEDAVETAEFLEWLVPDNFIFMGFTKFKVKNAGKGYGLEEIKKSSLGVCRTRDLMKTVFKDLGEEIETRIRSTFERPHMMVFDFFTSSPSIIYSKEPVDVVLIRQYGEDGLPSTVTVLLGRFARRAMMSRASDIPFLRKKLERIMVSENILPGSYMYREILTAFNFVPKRELFYVDRVSLSSMLNISASLQSDDEFHLLFRHNPEFEYLTATLIFSVQKYSLENLNRIKNYFRDTFDFKIVYDESSRSTTVTQVFIYFKVDKETKLDIDTEKIGNDISELLTTWNQHVTQKLAARLGDSRGFALVDSYCSRLTDLYKQAVAPDDAVLDILKLEEVEKKKSLQIEITLEPPTTATLRIYWNKEIDLMKLIPTFKNLGLSVKEEIALPLNGSDSENLYVQLLKIVDEEKRIRLLDEHRENLIEAIPLIISGLLEDCPLNRLILSAGFRWREVDLIRAYTNYQLLINKSVTPNSVTNTVNKYTQLVALAVSYFLEKFDPKKGDKKRMESIKEAFEKGLEEVTDLTEDSILRQLFNIMENTLRTNYFKDKDDYYLSIKLNCAGIIQMPKPVPMAEIFVHSPALEGVHLRGGKVARGGLRWSDRPDDFRTEVLGLMKTQMVKNAIIIPVGSKGGFVIKKMKFKTKAERMAKFKELYQTFIKGLLDLTDNLIDGEKIPPEGVVCYDKPDSYLVVAADKGTATMSDAANEMSAKYNFWLGDAFASGGAVGYDHKKFGITARGSWECIKRHFRELGVDIQNESINVVGIGDMSGDVFGNGMLLSEKIKLVAAFNHMHIFLDPDPDPEKSFKERKRLFETPGTAWTDYKKDIISPGGGVFLRSAKAILLSEEVQALLGVNKRSMSGRELIRNLLTAKVDLLYSGGIGTYIRSSGESNLDVGDKANDPVRVTADEVRAKVIGEGANLSLTQLARIEYAKHGGILNTDSVDNSAGVDISDHEVNIKILLEILLARNELKDKKERNDFFTKLGPEVVELVLKDNYLQSAGISLDQKRSVKRMDLFCDFIDHMVDKGLLDREGEFIPEYEELILYPKKPGYLLRPVLAVLFGYEKIRLTNEVFSSPLVGLAFSDRFLYDYFPQVVHRDFASSLDQHSLYKEIIATMICNKLVNQAGITFVYGIERATGFKPWEICRAYLIVENLLQADDFRKLVHDQDNKMEAQLQTKFLLKMEDLIARIVLWMLNHLPEDRISFDFINQYQEIIKRFKENLFEKLEVICSMDEGCVDEKVKKLEDKNVPPELGRWMVILPYLKDIMSIVSVKEQKHTQFMETGNLYITVTNAFEIDWISSALESYTAETSWEKRTVENLIRELEIHQSNLVLKILDFKRKGEKIDTAFANYIREKETAMDVYKETVEKIKEEKSNDLLAFGVLVRLLSEFD